MSLVNELNRLRGISQESAAFIYLNIFLDPAKPPELRFRTNPFGVRLFHDSLGNCYIFCKLLVTRIDHYRAVKLGVNAFVAGRFIPVVQMDCKDRVWMNLFGCSNDRLEHAFVCIASGAFRNLDDKRCLRFNTPTKKT